MSHQRKLYAWLQFLKSEAGYDVEYEVEGSELVPYFSYKIGRLEKRNLRSWHFIPDILSNGQPKPLDEDDIEQLLSALKTLYEKGNLTSNA